jgi:hypothetical protein
MLASVTLRIWEDMKSLEFVGWRVSKFFRFWVTGVVGSQIHRALKYYCAYRKQLCIAYKPTNHIFPRCNDNSDLCRRLLIAHPVGVCLVFTFHWNWFSSVTKLLVCLCFDSHHKRIYTICLLAEVILFTPYTHLSYMHPVLSLVIQQFYVPNSYVFYGTSYTPWVSIWGVRQVVLCGLRPHL